MMHTPVTDTTVERWSGFVLRVGVWSSATLMIFGLALAALQSFTIPAPEKNPSLAELARHIIDWTVSPVTLMYMGLVLLMFTPIIRVLTAIAGFAAERDRRFVLVGSSVLIMLLGEIVYSLFLKG